jgi:hypothetical protein
LSFPTTAASIVQSIVETYLQHYSTYKEHLSTKSQKNEAALAQDDNDTEMGERKQSVNLIVLVSQLYNFQVRESAVLSLLLSLMSLF